MAVITGVGQDAPMVVNEKGGKQSALDYRFDLQDPPALFNLAHILAQGTEKYGEDNWRQLSVADNINRTFRTWPGP